MLVPISWIKEFVNIEQTSLNNIIEKLTLAGFEVEDIINSIIFQNEEISLDISTTANRSDSLSVQGIIEEIAMLIDEPRQISLYAKKHDIFYNQIKNCFKIETKTLLNDCSVFSNFIVKNVTERPSPKWVKKKLLASGLTIQDNILDLQSYILLETGYPFEFYDLEKIGYTDETSELTIRLKNNENVKTIVGTNDVEYILEKETPVITANDNVISIAGIMPDTKYQCTKQTQTILIEGSIFGSKKIRQISRKLGVRTDRSARYEKSLNSSNFIAATYRLLSLLKMYDKSLDFKVHKAIQTLQPKQNKITLRYKNIIEILGSNNSLKLLEMETLDPKIISSYFKRLKFEIEFNEKKLEWLVRVPDSRIEDITREIDLIEEIARLHGFNNFKSAIPTIPQIGKQDSSYQIRKKLINCFLSEGFNELIQYSLVKDNYKESIKLINPLLLDCSCLRQTLLLNLITASNENIKQANFPLEGFEFGHIFSKDINQRYKEKEYVSGIFGAKQTKRNWSDKSKFLSWFEAKGKIENIFKKLNIDIKWNQKYIQNFEKIYENVLHPYRTAELIGLKNNAVGIFGQIHPLLAKKMSLPTETYLFELDSTKLIKQIEENHLVLYKNYSLYPKIIKDISFIIKEDITYNEISKLIIENGSQFLENTVLIDEYKSKSMSPNTHSLCIQLTFQSNNDTLITSEIEKILGNINFILEKKFQAVFRV